MSEDAAQATKPSRAGRNLPAAIGVALVLAGIVLASLFFERHVFAAVVAVAMAVGTYEFAGALRRGAGINVQLIPALVGGQAIIWLAWPFGLRGCLIAFVVTMLLCLLWRLPKGADGYVRDISASILTLAYLPLCGSFAVMLVLPHDGVRRVVALFLAVAASDIGGYAAGVLKGKHPMAPTISPKKSWEGFIGSVLAGIGVGILTMIFLLHGQWWQGAIFGVAIVLTATLGDLVESLIKRDVGIKDMGSLLPGHGGLMDRLDSLLLSVVPVWALLALFV